MRYSHVYGDTGINTILPIIKVQHNYEWYIILDHDDKQLYTSLCIYYAILFITILEYISTYFKNAYGAGIVAQ